jgi:hypothetical protein
MNDRCTDTHSGMNVEAELVFLVNWCVRWSVTYSTVARVIRNHAEADAEQMAKLEDTKVLQEL